MTKPLRADRDYTFGELYNPAMQIKSQKEADRYLQLIVKRDMECGRSKQDAEQIHRSNLGYIAGYYDVETRIRVERLFKCSHPVFGSTEQNGTPTASKAFQVGIRLGRSYREMARRKRD